MLVKCVVSSGSAWITLSICISFTLLFCFDNFVNWHSLSSWIGFEVVNILVSQRSSFFFRNVVEFRTFTWTTFAFTGVLSEQCSNDIFFSFPSSLKRPISPVREEIWLWRLQRSYSRCPFSFVSLRSCCFTSRRIACFSCILTALS